MPSVSPLSLVRVMANLRAFGPLATFVYAAAAAMTLCVALVWIGPAALADRQKLVELAIFRPMPLIVQDVLKFILAIATVGMIAALFQRLRGRAPRLMRVAATSGLLSVLCLVLNASLSFLALWHATDPSAMSGEARLRLAAIIGVLGLGVIVLSGVWYLLVNWSALKQNRLRRGLCYLGLMIGVLSLIPVLGLLALSISIVWSVGLGRELLKDKGAG